MTTKLTQAMIDGATQLGRALLSAASPAAARGLLELSDAAPLPPNYLTGLELSNNASDAVNYIDVSPGACRDAADGANIVLASAVTKRLDAAWVVGSGEGGRDTGAIVDGWWHIHAIFNLTTGQKDVLLSLSATNPTMPSGWGNRRRLGAVQRLSGAIVGFRQYGDVFKRNAQAVVRNSTATTSNALLDMLVPTGVKVSPLFIADLQLSTAGSAIQLFSDGDVAAANESAVRVAGLEYGLQAVAGMFMTNQSGQLRYTLLNSSGTLSIARVQTQGWVDRRGR